MSSTVSWLSSFKELCILLGGEITFTSVMGKGSTFIVHIPWTWADRLPLSSPMTERIDKLTAPHRADFLSEEAVG